MEGILTSISDLVASADLACSGDVPGAHAMLMLDACAPSLVFVAGKQGDLISLDTFDTDLGPKGAASLASQLAVQLKQDGTCTWQASSVRGRQQAMAVRLPEQANSLTVGVVFQQPPPYEASADPLGRASLVAGTLAWVCAYKSDESRSLRARLEQLQAELESLRNSHADAVATAIEEREERLRQHEEHASQLQAVMMMAADGIVTVDETGMIQSFNEAAGWIFGYAPSEVIGKHISILLPDPNLGENNDAPSGLPSSCEITPFGSGREVIGLRKDGTTFPMDLAVSEVCLGSRKIFTGIFRDITERKNAEEALRRLHAQNESILNSAGEGIIGLDASGAMMFVNPAAARMLGWGVAELIGKPLHNTVHHSKPDGSPYPVEECDLLRQTAGRTAVPVSSSQTFWRKDGTSFPVECTSTAMREEAGVAGLVLTFRDITERRTLESQLRQAQKLESIGQLAAGIAHEINTPTQYIGDNTRFLQESFEELHALLTVCLRLRDASRSSGAPPAVAEIVEAVDRADVDYLLEEIPKAVAQSLEGVERVAKIVRSMKEFSHPNGESFQAVDLNHAIESTLTVSRNEWKYVAEAVTEFDSTLPLVTCLPGDINQVVLNLIVNAAHAIEERVGDGGNGKGRIVVRTRLDGDWVEIRVEDNGTGIPKEIQARIYDPFFTTKPVGRGTGQGLAISHSIIREKHHGTIAFDTKPDCGTAFIVRLPVHQKASTSGEVRDETAPVVRG
jgi:PAS domain S-box-containing protein